MLVILFGQASFPAFAASETAPVSAETASAPLEDGIYLIRGEHPVGEAASPAVKADETEITDDYFFLEEKPTDPPRVFVVGKKPEVPLILDSEPGKGSDASGKPLLHISIAPEQVEPLKKFTGSHIMSRIAIILQGKVVTMHKIRAEITDGKVQITRCTDNACERLFIELKKKVRK